MALSAPDGGSSMAVSALDIRGLAKHFDKPAVDGLDLKIRTGESQCCALPAADRAARDSGCQFPLAGANAMV